MAEAFLQFHAGDRFEVMSAGIEPGTLNQNVVKVMLEAGIDISGNTTKSVFDLHKNAESFSYVITVCSREAAEQCPFFPGESARLHWPLDDPSKFEGSSDEILEQTRHVRDDVEMKVKQFIDAHEQGAVDADESFMLNRDF